MSSRRSPSGWRSHAAGFALLISSGWLEAAQRLPVDLTLVPPGEKNTIDLQIEGDVLGQIGSDSATGTISGNILATLGLAIDPATYQVLEVQTVELDGGRIAISDTSFSLNWGIIVGRLDIAAAGLGGTFDTPNPPGIVSAGTFNAADH